MKSLQTLYEDLLTLPELQLISFTENILFIYLIPPTKHIIYAEYRNRFNQSTGDLLYVHIGIRNSVSALSKINSCAEKLVPFSVRVTKV